jgi:transposase
MVRVPTAEEEDRRRLCRERRTLTAERIEHVNCIKGLLFSQGVVYEPLHGNRRKRLQDLKTGDGRPLPSHLKTVNLTGSNLLLKQIAAVQAERASDVAFEANFPGAR